MAIRRIGPLFVDMGFITDDQLEMLLEEQSQNPGQLLGKIAEDMGLITDDQLAQALAEQMNIQFVDLEGVEIPQNVLAEISDAMAQLYKVVPLRLSDDILTIATCDPQNLSMQDELRRFLGFEIRLLVATESQIDKAINKYYSEETDSIESIITELENDEALMQQPVIAIGDPGVNAASAYFATRLPAVYAVENACQVLLDSELLETRVCLWGVNDASTAAAIEYFEQKWLEPYLDAVEQIIQA